MEGGGEKKLHQQRQKTFFVAVGAIFFHRPLVVERRRSLRGPCRKHARHGLSLHDAREHALTKVGPDRREEYLKLKYVVTVAKSHTQKDCQSCHETTVLSVGDILPSYGPPLFIRYQLVPPAAAPRVTVNAFDVQ